MPTKDKIQREKSTAGRDPVAEAARDRKNLIAKKRRALDKARTEFFQAERVLQMWRNEETRLNSSRFHQITEAKARIETRKGIVLGLKAELSALGVSV